MKEKDSGNKNGKSSDYSKEKLVPNSSYLKIPSIIDSGLNLATKPLLSGISTSIPRTSMQMPNIATWNSNGFFNQDGTLKMIPGVLSNASSISLREVNGNRPLWETLNQHSAVTGIAKGLLNEFSTESKLYGPYKTVFDHQTKLLRDAFKLSKTLGHAASSFVVSNISPLASSITEIGLTSVNTGRLYASGSISGETMKLTENISSLCIRSVQSEQDSLIKLFSTSINDTFKAYLPSTSFISTGINTLLHSLPYYPTSETIPQFRKVEDVVKLYRTEILEHHERLDQLLNKIDTSLVEYRTACWEVFNRKGTDYIGQAASSMRRLVDKLFRILAPLEEVEKTQYFKNSKKAKDSSGKPTREAKIYYVANYEKDKRAHIERLSKGFLEAWNNLSAWDHEPLDKDGFVYGALIVIEGHLISLLSANTT